jgi:hypothetical protein
MRGRRRALAVAGLAVSVCSLQGLQFVRSLRPRPTVGVDFFQDWASARNLLISR